MKDIDHSIVEKDVGQSALTNIPYNPQHASESENVPTKKDTSQGENVAMPKVMGWSMNYGLGSIML